MKGMKCRCGYASVSEKTRCPRCGRQMKAAEWPDQGKVLSFTPLQAIPEGLENPYNLVLVELDEKGPKVVCWTSGRLKEPEEVVVTELNGKLICAPKTKLKFVLGEETKSQPNR